MINQDKKIKELLGIKGEWYDITENQYKELMKMINDIDVNVLKEIFKQIPQFTEVDKDLLNLYKAILQDNKDIIIRDR